MDNASNVIDVASVPFQEHLASASMTLPANNAALSTTTSLQVQYNTPNLFLTTHSSHLIDEATKAYQYSSLITLMYAQPSGTDTCIPSKPYALHLHNALLAALTHPSPSLTSQASTSQTPHLFTSLAGDVSAAVHKIDRMAHRVDELTARSQDRWKEYQVITDRVGRLSKERVEDELERLNGEAEALKAEALEAEHAATDAAHAAARASKMAVKGASEMRTSVGVMQSVGALIKELEAMWAHMRPRMPLVQLNL
ncbi:hypothetical protein CPB85DRAFT_1444066 [Mucidula mucida]|nr:hypothetical protein CPB85DRAFT_1444066 [Mucidula mucida]